MEGSSCCLGNQYAVQFPKSSENQTHIYIYTHIIIHTHRNERLVIEKSKGNSHNLGQWRKITKAAKK